MPENQSEKRQGMQYLENENDPRKKVKLKLEIETVKLINRRYVKHSTISQAQTANN